MNIENIPPIFSPIVDNLSLIKIFFDIGHFTMNDLNLIIESTFSFAKIKFDSNTLYFDRTNDKIIGYEYNSCLKIILDDFQILNFVVRYKDIIFLIMFDELCYDFSNDIDILYLDNKYVLKKHSNNLLLFSARYKLIKRWKIGNITNIIGLWYVAHFFYKI
jgi:hypothetical protein